MDYYFINIEFINEKKIDKLIDKRMYLIELKRKLYAKKKRIKVFKSKKALDKFNMLSQEIAKLSKKIKRIKNEVSFKPFQVFTLDY